VTTGYKKQGAHWTTCGWHTGQDYAAPAGTPIAAARAGTVEYVNYGSSFGSHTWVVRPGDGTEDFYAHAKVRPPSGVWVTAGQIIGQVGAEGNATGPHLHFERHSSYGWSCGNMSDPMTSHNAGAGSTAPPASGSPWAAGDVYVDKLAFGSMDSDSVRRLQYQLNGVSLEGGQELPITGNYLEQTDNEVRLWQDQIAHDPPDPVGKSFLGPNQTALMFPVPPYVIH
jgi:Peptidase family M23